MADPVWFASESAGNPLWALSESAGSVPVIVSITPAETSIDVAWTGTATHYRIDGGTTTALPDGTSPDTITGFASNTEYNAPGLELSGDGGSTWSDPVAFGTLNPGGGGGPVPAYADITQADGAATASSIAGASSAAASITQADGAATPATLAGAAQFRASITPADGVATTATLFSDGDFAAITPAAGAATAATIAGSAIARAAIVAASGSAAAATLAGEGVTPEAASITIRLLSAASAGSALPSLTDIEWAWWDDAITLADTWGVAPTNSGTAESTDGSGEIILAAPSSAKTTGERAFIQLHWVDGDNVRTFGARLTVD